MFWRALSVLLCPLYVLVGRLLGDDRDRLILALRQQVLILQRQLGKRPTLTRSERLALVLACASMASGRLLEALVIVQPDSLVRWHREIVRRHWRLRSRRRAGRPPVLQRASASPIAPTASPAGARDYPRDGEVARRQVLGGLINDYYRKAA